MPNRSVAIIGAGPAGVYAADILQGRDEQVRIDLFEKLPAPYGLVRYGVSPDHPRIKKIQDALHDVLENPRIRLVCNVEIGTDVTIAELRDAYDAVVISTGADRDVDLAVPGAELPGSYGGADFVAWYDGHPDAPQQWQLSAESVAVIGAGNVALDVARMIITHPHQLEQTDIPDHVEAAFRQNPVRDLHLLIRRGPADVRFSPMELRELGAREDVDVIVDPADMELDEHAERMVAQFNQRRIIVKTLTEWAHQDPATLTASRRVHLHFFQQPSRILGTDRVTAIEMERTQPDELGRITGTGETVQHNVGAVYRTIGYRSTPVPGVPFDDATGTIPDDAGRILDADGEPIPGLYATGWIRRGPVGLIGSTKSDAAEAIDSLITDLAARPGAAPEGAADALVARLTDAVGWDGWLRIDEAEKRLGAERGRERTKIVTREALMNHAREMEHTR
ncbi:FAD-dependent oxidoreductase [Leucobacter aridicollis]|uniref:ferredoxin--NADP(+) reductase n=1 Tax=Leucobacter aridicollis TaxID=283878 RepID=A0A852R2P7_9MICO|nr:FAD-dependent oxidoreductase [Leucobacter aridicollis]MBL3682477.1 pyridine nucleotide-disulfide oxidoreductase [Leucobacter aridicollis]NYD25895.1 ferredoxin--NADP+ reductase [Leucobacter aridicollis]